MVGRVPSFQPDGPRLIPGGTRDFNFDPGTDVCPLSMFYPVLSLAEALNSDHRFREVCPCVPA